MADMLVRNQAIAQGFESFGNGRVKIYARLTLTPPLLDIRPPEGPTPSGAGLSDRSDGTIHGPAAPATLLAVKTRSSTISLKAACDWPVEFVRVSPTLDCEVSK